MYARISGSEAYRAALYIRLSREDDNERESESVANQRSLLSDFAERSALKVVDAYVDDGYSGTSFDRPGFKRMLADIEAGKVNMVITKDMSRLGRDYIQTGYYLERFFPEKRVRYISLLDGVDTGLDSAANDITPFKAIMNDMYAKDVSQKITSVKRDKQRKGMFIGGKAPYGYKLSETRKNAIEIDEPAADIVRRIFSLALDGISCRRIAGMLNDEAVPTPARYANLNLPARGPHSGLWSAESIAFILKNETYIGSMVQGRTRKISYKLKKSRRLPPEEWTVVKNTHRPIVSREDFERVRRLIESRKHTRLRTHDYLLKGMIHCAECGYPLGVIMRTLSGDRPTLYFVCRTYQRLTSHKKCTCHCARVDAVTEAVAAGVREVCVRYLDRGECEELVDRAAREAKADSCRKKGAEGASAQIEALTRRLDKVYADRLSGLLDEGDFSRIYRKIREERSRLKEHVKSPEPDRANELAHDESVDELIQAFLDAAQSDREIMTGLIERVDLTRDREARIRFRFRGPEAAERLQ